MNDILSINSLKVTIKDPAGMHARPCAVLAKKAKNWDYTIKLRKVTNNPEDEENFRKNPGSGANIKSIMGIMALGITQGSTVEFFITKNQNENDDKYKKDKTDLVLKEIKEFLIENKLI